MKERAESLHPLAPALSGFEQILRFWDPKRNITMAKIQPGEFYVTWHDEAIVTVLGSCIAVCIRDVDLGIGGMNHFMLPIKGSVYDKSLVASDAARYGNWAMEYLINQILKAGGRRRVLEAKVFGGGNVFPGLSSMVSDQNINFALEYVYNENLTLKAKDIGGNLGRIVMYYPKTGLVKVKYLDKIRDYGVYEKEQQYIKSIDKNLSGDIELF